MEEAESRRGFAEEFANCVTHGVGLALSLAGLVVLVVLAAIRGTAWHIVTCSVYGATLVLLYTASTLYHGVRTPRARRVLRIIDHGAIYLLIAGTYTPFMLVNLRGGLGWTLFGLVWGWRSRASSSRSSSWTASRLLPRWCTSRWAGWW